MRYFRRDSLEFLLPDGWAADVEELEAGFSVTVASEEFGFFLATLQPEQLTAQAVVDEALQALRQDYKDLDIQDVVQSVSGLAATGYDLDIITVDTVAQCQLRAVETPDGPLLYMVQTAAQDSPETKQLLANIFDSVAILGDDDDERPPQLG